jgi:hypothetical protein
MYLGQEDERTNGRTNGRTDERNPSFLLLSIEYIIYNVAH